MLSLQQPSSTTKRAYCVCEKDVFIPNDCDCGYNDEQSLLHLKKKQRKNEDDSFLEEYPSTIFSAYTLFNGKRLSNDLDTDEVKDFAMDYLVRLWTKKSSFGLRDRAVLKTCIALAVDYDFKGFHKFRTDWHDQMYGRGELKTIRRLDVVQNESVIVECVGEERDIITPSREVEEVICKFVKSVATVETWRTRDNFIDTWNKTYFPGLSNYSIRRYVCLGWRRNCYVGWDWGSNGGEVIERREFVMLDSFRFGKYWDEAYDCVRALLIIDALLKWALDGVRSGWTQKVYEYTRPFDIGFDQ
jgi:hypothetical protein